MPIASNLLEKVRAVQVIRELRRVPGVQYSYERLKNRSRRDFVRTLIPRNTVGAELGVQKGYFTSVLLRETSPERLYIVDPWYLLEKEWSWSGGNRSTSAALAGVIRRFEDELVDGTLELRIADDVEFLTQLPPDHLDWAYIDSSHEYAHTVAELELLRTRVKPGGVIAGDDWNPSATARHSGVGQAVTEFIDRYDAELLYHGSQDLQWAIRRP